MVLSLYSYFIFALNEQMGQCHMGCSSRCGHLLSRLCHALTQISAECPWSAETPFPGFHNQDSGRKSSIPQVGQFEKTSMKELLKRYKLGFKKSKMEQITVKGLTTSWPGQSQERVMSLERERESFWKRPSDRSCDCQACSPPQTTWHVGAQEVNTLNALSSHPSGLLSMSFLGQTKQNNIWLSFLEPRTGRRKDLERQKEEVQHT